MKHSSSKDIPEYSELDESTAYSLPDEIVVEKPVVIVPQKVQYRFVRRIGKDVILVDSKENGFLVPDSDEYKNLKLGDVVYR